MLPFRLAPPITRGGGNAVPCVTHMRDLLSRSVLGLVRIHVQGCSLSNQGSDCWLAHSSSTEHSRLCGIEQSKGRACQVKRTGGR